MNIAFFELEQWETDFLKQQFPKAKFYTKTINEVDISEIKDIEIAAIFIYSKINIELLEKLPKLRLVTTMSTGYEHIDTQACKHRNVVVCNVPTYGENTVAEHTFALILALSRKIVDSVERTRGGDFSVENLRGFDLAGKTIGVVGCGNIGKHVIRVAKGFGMNVIVFDPKQDPSLETLLGFKYAAFNDLLGNSDIITLHAPYNRITHHMINSSNIGMIKKGAILINTARGGLIETEALAKAIEEGTLSAAGLDVLEEECFIKEEKQILSKEFEKTCDLKTVIQEHILLKHRNVIITPHNAFNSNEAMQRILDTTTRNIKEFDNWNNVNVVN